MKKFRVLNIIVSALLLLAVIVAIQAFSPSSIARASSQTNSGFGVPSCMYVQQSLAGSSEQGASVGMGALRRFEAQQSQANSGGQGASVGMGTLRCVDAQQSLASSSAYAGMGGLHRFEASQAGSSR